MIGSDSDSDSNESSSSIEIKTSTINLRTSKVSLSSKSGPTGKNNIESKQVNSSKESI